MTAKTISTQAKDESQPLFHLRSLEMHRLLALRPGLRGNPGHLRADHRRPRLRSKVSPGMTSDFMSSECVSCGACVQACPTATLTRNPSSTSAQPEHGVVTTCAYCGVGCGFKAEMRGDEVVRMVPYKDGKANAAIPASKAVRLGLRHPPGTHPKPMIRASHQRSVARSELGGGDQPHRQRIQAHPGEIRPECGRRHHLFALHQ